MICSPQKGHGFVVGAEGWSVGVLSVPSSGLAAPHLPQNLTPSSSNCPQVEHVIFFSFPDKNVGARLI
jgi:hypothetical protein